jgi:hypothetical protein
MHTERLTTLAEWLEAGAKHERIKFDMTTGITLEPVDDHDLKNVASCGTSCCIAGAAVQFFSPASLAGVTKNLDRDDDLEITWPWVAERAQFLLDLGDDTADMLFQPADHFGGHLSNYDDPAWAARTIRRLIETGEVDWNATREGGAA